jgi:hypothetical protein
MLAAAPRSGCRCRYCWLRGRQPLIPTALYIVPVRLATPRAEARLKRLLAIHVDSGAAATVGKIGCAVHNGDAVNGTQTLKVVDLAADRCGCGGPQQIVPAALLGGSVNVKTLAFLTEVPDVRPSLG